MSKSSEVRTTIITLSCLADRVAQHCKNRGENLSDFYNRAVLNQLENDGDFEVRDIVETEAKRLESEIKWL